MVMRMAEMSWVAYRDEIAAGAPVIVPVAALEQHGPHMPLGTDTFLADAICGEAARRHGRAIMAPVLVYGAKSQPGSGGGQTFSGTVSLDAATLIGQIRDIIRELVRHGCRRIAVAICHYENLWYATEAIDLGLREAVWNGVHDLKVIQVSPGSNPPRAILDAMFPEGFPGMALEHAARMETSMMLHLHPGLVRTDLIPDDPRAAFAPYQTFPHHHEPTPPSGVLSPAHGCSAEFGRALVEDAIAELVDALRAAFD